MKFEFENQEIDYSEFNIKYTRIIEKKESEKFIEITLEEPDPIGDLIQFYVGKSGSNFIICDDGDTMFLLDPCQKNVNKKIKINEILKKYNIYNTEYYGLTLKTDNLHAGIFNFIAALKELYV